MPDIVLDYHRKKIPIDHPDGSITDAKIYSLTRGKISDLWSSPFWNNIPDKPSTFPPSAHASSHEYGGADLVRNLDYLAIRGTTVIDSSRNLMNVTLATGLVKYSNISPSTGGLLGIWSTYYTGASPYELDPVLMVVHSTIDFTDYNPSGFADYYSLLAIGWVIPLYSETYTFYLTSDDGVACSINGTKIVADNTTHGATTYSGTISLTANKIYPVLIGHFEHSTGERLLFEWSSTSQARQTVPSTQMAYPILGAVLGSESPAYGGYEQNERPKYDWLLHELKMKKIPNSVEEVGIPEAMRHVEKKYGWENVVEQAKSMKDYLSSKGISLSTWFAWENDFKVKWVRLEVKENNKTHNSFIDIGVRKDCFELSGDIVVGEKLPSKIGNAFLELQTSDDYGDEINGFSRENHYIAKMYYKLNEKPTVFDDAVAILKAIGKVR